MSSESVFFSSSSRSMRSMNDLSWSFARPRAETSASLLCPMLGSLMFCPCLWIAIDFTKGQRGPIDDYVGKVRLTDLYREQFVGAEQLEVDDVAVRRRRRQVEELSDAHAARRFSFRSRRN